MKFDCGLTHKEKRKYLEDWHRWFAWHPVQVGSHDCRWLEHVERKGTYRVIEGFIFMYRYKWDHRKIS